MPVVGGDAAIVMQEAAEVDERGRLHLLPRWMKRVDWMLSQAKNDFVALMVFVEPNRVSIRDWKIYGPSIERRYKELAKETDADSREALRLIQDRYGRLFI